MTPDGDLSTRQARHVLRWRRQSHQNVEAPCHLACGIDCLLDACFADTRGLHLIPTPSSTMLQHNWNGTERHHRRTPLEAVRSFISSAPRNRSPSRLAPRKSFFPAFQANDHRRAAVVSTTGATIDYDELTDGCAAVTAPAVGTVPVGRRAGRPAGSAAAIVNLIVRLSPAGPTMPVTRVHSIAGEPIPAIIWLQLRGEADEDGQQLESSHQRASSCGCDHHRVGENCAGSGTSLVFRWLPTEARPRRHSPLFRHNLIERLISGESSVRQSEER